MRIISMFAGIGGFELAFNIKGFRTIWANEQDKYAIMTFKDNFPHINLIEGDIREIATETIPEHDILVGGFPCQPWSTANQGGEKGLNDPRGLLFKEIIRVLEAKRPKYFLLENVKGLTSKRNSEAFKYIISELERLNYKVDYKVLNAKHYGVPQNRERVFIVGNIYGLSFEWPKPSNKPVKISDILETSIINSKYYLSNEKWKEMLNKQWKISGSNKETFNFNEKYGDSEEIITFQSKWTKHIASEELNKEGITPAITASTTDTPFIFQNRRGTIRTNKENISPTLTGNMGTGGNNQPHIYQNRPRKLTPRECLRLQGFPEWFRQVVSNSQFYKQIGNAVAVPVVRALAEEIKRQWITTTA